MWKDAATVVVVLCSYSTVTVKTFVCFLVLVINASHVFSLVLKMYTVCVRMPHRTWIQPEHPAPHVLVRLAVRWVLCR